MNERIRKLRRELDLTQTEFAERIGSVQNTITGYESGKRTPSNLVIASICKEFNVNESWLRYGEGEMFLPETQDAIEALAASYNLEPAIEIIIRKLVSLSKQQQKVISDLIMDTAIEVSQMINNAEEDDIERQVEEYRKSLEEQRRRRVMPLDSQQETFDERRERLYRKIDAGIAAEKAALAEKSETTGST